MNGVWQVAGVLTATLKSGGSIKFRPQPSDDTWSWTGPNGFSSNSREAGVNNIQTKNSKKYIGTFSTVAGCVKTISFSITVDGVCAVYTPKNENLEIRSYPNPAKDVVTLINIPVNTSITVFNLCGQLLLRKKSTVENEIIDVHNLRAGSYFIRIGESECKTLKLLKI